MTDKIFIDTNILVYAHDASAGDKYDKARVVFLDLWKNKTGCLSIQVMQEFYVTVTQKAARPMDHLTAAGIIHNLSYWRVHEPKSGDVIRAIDLQKRYKVSFWDAMILQSASQLDCSVIWSEDLSPGQVYEGMRLVNPLN